MKIQNIKILLFVSIMFVVVNIVVYLSTNYNKQERIDVELNKNIGTIKDHYNLLLNMKSKSADIMFESLTNNKEFKDILKKANKETSKEKLKDLTKKLNNLVKNKFKLMKKRGIKLGLITLANNKVFLRLHKPNKSGDDISKVRYAVTQVNKHHKIIRGFEKGKISHALRNIYPIFDDEGNFLASIDIAFDISIIEDKLLDVSQLHTHIIIHKDILESRVIAYTGKEIKYKKALEHEDFRIRNLQTKYHDDNYNKLLKNKNSKLYNQVQNNLQNEESFAIYFKGKNKQHVVSFLPIKNIKENKASVWIISIKESEFLSTTLRGVMIVRIIVFIATLLLAYFIYRTLVQKYVLDKKVQIQTQKLKRSNKELKKSKQELQLINDSLENKVKERTKELEEQTQKAQSATKAKGEFLANMSHEIRTPLNAILGFIDILKKEDDKKKSLEYIETIEKSGESLLQIIEDILDFSKIESGKLDIEKIYFDPVEEFSVITDLFGGKCSLKGINFVSNISKELPHSIETDPLRVKQVISNLLSNAVKFTDSGKNITIKIVYENKYLSVYVKDEGIGISKNKLEHIFEAFHQEDSSTTREYGGTGLGLAISSQLINLLGGELKVRSKVGEGSEFYFSIPANCGKKIIVNKHKNEEYIFNHVKLLVVEDNLVNQELLKIILNNKNIKYDIANDGFEATVKYKTNSYDAVLMDENMPNMNGIEATKDILIYEKENSLEHTPIIALTANAMKGDRERFLSIGMDEYLTKPIDVKKLFEVLHRFVSDKIIQITKDGYNNSIKELHTYKNMDFSTMSDNDMKKTFHSIKILLTNIDANELSELADEIERTLDKDLIETFLINLDDVI
jgi:signal transduction histidine kinase/CheY-like chemotaxis protein